MNLPDKFPGRSLQPFNTLAVPSAAGHYVRVSTVAELRQALELASNSGLDLLVLGGGSNVVLPEFFNGLAIHMGIPGYTVVDENDTHLWLRVGAGEIWQDLIEYCLDCGFYGLENLSLIPGTVGAAPIQNIGAYGVELNSVFCELTALERRSGREVVFDHAACEFGYRDSVFKNRLKDQYVITSVTFRLGKYPAFDLHYAPLQEALGELPPSRLTGRMVSDAVTAIRRRKLPDPAELPNAGSFFKNPVIAREQLAALRKQYPGIVTYPVDGSRVKLAAAWLLEEAGWRGHSQSGIGMHERQALVLVNPGRCSGERVLDYASTIQNDVYRRFGVLLEREPVACGNLVK